MTSGLDLDHLLTHRIRAGVMAYLSADGDGDFSQLATALDTPNNALSSQLYRLEAAGYVRLEKGFLGRRPRTRIRLTAAGRAAWTSYLAGLEAHLPR